MREISAFKNGSIAKKNEISKPEVKPSPEELRNVSSTEQKFIRNITAGSSSQISLRRKS